MATVITRLRKRPASWRRVYTAVFIGVCVGAACLMAVGTPAVHGQSPGVSREYPLKAAFLYNFGNYVEWPTEAFASGDAPFVLGIMGPDPFGALLNEVAATKQLQGRTIEIRHVAAAGDAAACQILFIGATVHETDRRAAIEATRATPVLIVGETPGSAEQGGAVINFFVEQNRVRFEINVQAAQERQLKISSKLISLAKVVEPRRVADQN